MRDLAVVGAAIVRDGKVLCARRGKQQSLPGMWEFPGGKIEPDETPQVALLREVSEELGCLVAVGQEVNTTVYEYDTTTIVLTIFWCTLLEGVPTASEHEELRWVGAGDLSRLEWAPADLPALKLVEKELNYAG